MKPDGSTGYFTVTTDSDLNITAQALTVECWAKVSAIQSQTLVGKANVSSPDAGYFLTLLAAGTVRAGLYPGAVKLATSTRIIGAGTYHHLVMTYDGTNLKLYINGRLDQQTAATGNITSASAYNVRIAARDQTTPPNATADGGFYNGTIDEVAIYNVALTQAQIMRHYKSGTAVPRTAA